MVQELQALGITSTKAFRLFCRRLNVPLIYAPGGAFVEVGAFQLAMRAISRIGQTDFKMPGRFRVHKTVPHKYELDPAYVEENIEYLIAENFLARRDTMKARNQLRTEIRETASRMRRFFDMADVCNLQREAAEELVEEARKIRRTENP